MPPSPSLSGQRLLVQNAPIHFLKQHVIKSHFGKFGTISSLVIDKRKRSCIITFLRSDHAEQAIKNGTAWKNFKLELSLASSASFVSSVSASNYSCDIESELNWFAEEDYESPFTQSNLLLNEGKNNMESKKSCSSPKRPDDSNDSQKKKMHLSAEDSKEFSNRKITDIKQEVKNRGSDEEIVYDELLNKLATTVSSRLALLEERDKILRIKLNRDSNIKTAVAIKGLCPDMCPEKERILRDVRGIVACYEAVDGMNLKMDHSKAVKDYARSSADQEEPLAHELRPEPVLTMTMDYLITQIMTKIDTGEEDNLGNWYDFCWYRLRSIRKDIIQQQLCDINTVEIVEKCARFHICCFDRLWGASKSIFDDKINSETLMNCLQSLMHMYEDLRKQGTECPNEAEFRAYLILLKLNSGFLLSEYQQYSPVLQRSPPVKDAVLIHTAYSNNMYSTYFRLMRNTSYLNCCLMQRFLAHLRTKALEIIVRAHCPPNKISRLPVSFILHTLKFDSRKDCISFCESFGLVLAEDSYNFIVSRNEFFFPESLFVISTPSSIVVRKRVSVAKAVVGANANLPFYILHEVHSSFNEDGTLKQGALDATDQEEKLYRDIVERKLILKRGSLNFSLPNTRSELEIKVIATPPPSPRVLNMSTQSNVATLMDIPPEEEIDYINEDHSERDGIEVTSDKVTDFKEDMSESDSVKSNSSDTASEPETESQHISSYPTNELINKSSCSSAPKINFKQHDQFILNQTSIIQTKSPSVTFKSSPCILTKSPFIFPKSPSNIPNISGIPPKSPVSLQKSPLPQPKSQGSLPKASGFSPKSPNFLQRSPDVQARSSRFLPNPPISPFVPAKKRKINSPLIPVHPVLTSKCEPEKYFPKKVKVVTEKLCLTKLKKIRSSEKMKRVSLRKYALLWRNKVEKLKKIGDKSLREYLFYWGTPKQCSIPKNGFNNWLFQKKKTGLVVLSILHSDIVDRLDPETGKIGELLSDKLGRLSLNFALLHGNVTQPYPVFWKLVFALPPALKDPFTFPVKLKRWCTTAFYSDTKAKLGEVQYRLSSAGVPVFISVNVLMGSKSFEEYCTNISAAIVIRAHGWETKEQTQQRCDRLISSTENKFPLSVLTLGETFESCNHLRYHNRLTNFSEYLWDTTDILFEALNVLAENTYFQRIKVDSLRNLITNTSEKLFDALHEEKFINDGLYDVLCEPNNVILFYNELINKLEKEIIACYESNVYGTASEFEQKIKNCHTQVVKFPSHYRDWNFQEILKKYLRKALLPELKWPFVDSKELLSVFKDYCHSIQCDRILSKLIRAINPPDSDDLEHPLNQHLELIPWLRIVEDITKEVLMQEHFIFNVVYRQNKITEIIDSNWWMSSDIVIKALSQTCKQL